MFSTLLYDSLDQDKELCNYLEKHGNLSLICKKEKLSANFIADFSVIMLFKDFLNSIKENTQVILVDILVRNP